MNAWGWTAHTRCAAARVARGGAAVCAARHRRRRRHLGICRAGAVCGQQQQRFRAGLVREGILTLRGRLAWAHDDNPDRSIAATFQALPGASFVVNGAAQAPDSALTTASAEMKWTNGWSAAATFEGEFSDVTRSYGGKAVLRYQW